MIDLKINLKTKKIIFLFVTIGLLWGLTSYNSNYSQLKQGNPFILSMDQTFNEEEEDERDSYEFDYFLLSHSLEDFLKSKSKITDSDCTTISELISSVLTPPPNFS